MEVFDTPVGESVTDSPPAPPDAENWRQDTTGRWFTPSRVRKGVIWWKGSETVEEAHAADKERTEAKQAGTPLPRTRKRRGPDPRPKTAAPKASKPRPTVDMLAVAVEPLLSIPAGLYATMILECPFCAQQMLESAPAAAKDIASLADKSESWRKLLEWWHGLMTVGAGSTGLARFVAVPAIHHYAPAPVAAIAGPLLVNGGMPPRPSSQPPSSATQSDATSPTNMSPKPTSRAHSHMPFARPASNAAAPDTGAPAAVTPIRPDDANGTAPDPTTVP